MAVVPLEVTILSELKFCQFGYSPQILGKLVMRADSEVVRPVLLWGLWQQGWLRPEDTEVFGVREGERIQQGGQDMGTTVVTLDTRHCESSQLQMPRLWKISEDTEISL